MKTYFNFFIYSIMALLIAGCTKEEMYESPTDDPITTSRASDDCTIRLSKYFHTGLTDFIDVTYNEDGSIKSFLPGQEFVYNNGKVMKNIINPFNHKEIVYKYYQNGDISAIVYYNTQIFDYYYVEFFYNNQQLALVKTTYKHAGDQYQNVNKIEYEYNNGRVVKIKQGTNNSFITKHLDYDSNGNVTSEKVYQGSDFVELRKYKYDKNHNPYYSTLCHMPIDPANNWLTMYGFETMIHNSATIISDFPVGLTVYSPNNLVRMDILRSSSFAITTEKHEWRYKYDSEGYPFEGEKRVSQNGVGVEVRKLAWKYETY